MNQTLARIGIKTMIMKQVNSDGIIAAGYTKEYMEVEFRGGRTHRYKSVPYGVYSDLLNSSSKVTYMNIVLKNYDYDRVK